MTGEKTAGEKIDRTGLEIVRQLQEGRKSYKEIGQALGLSEATIRSKVTKMTREGLVDIKALVSTKDMEIGHQTVYIGVRLRSPAIKAMAEAISELPGVISAAMVTGRFDLMLTVMLTPAFGLMDFFNVLLEKYSDNIRSNETFMVYESVNLKTPYPY
jgi:Lrp/AsnC family transcriptional regulator for asnA, asnC and gidA